MALKKPDTQTGISSEKNHTILIKWLLKIENGKNNNNNNNDNNDNKKNKIKWKEENVCISSEKNHTILTKCLLKIENGKKKKKKKWKEENVRSGIWTHALSREPELESGALDHSAILTI